jgi:ferric-dicitrate binding protein FerR (iron transport regulator)
MEIDPEILRRYWKKECSEEEKRQVERWLEAGEPEGDYGIGDDLDEGKLQQELWALLVPKSPSLPVQQDGKGLSDSSSPKRRRTLFWVSGVAASIVLVGLWMFVFSRLQDRESELQVAKYEEITAPYGRRMTVTLIDGTRIELNSGSTLRYPEMFNGKTRHVVLEGEAFFQVAKDSARPFIAETARTTTQVLGTRFNLRDFAEESTSSLVVEEGKVQFTGNGCTATLLLVANERAVFSENSMHKSYVHSTAYTDWRENILRFNDITLEEAIPMVERWYDINITLKDPKLAQLKIKGGFKQMSLEKLMDEFTYLMNLRYSIDKKNVLLYK